eukprot:3240748-Prymnesium_polylepis.1
MEVMFHDYHPGRKYSIALGKLVYKEPLARVPPAARMGIQPRNHAGYCEGPVVVRGMHRGS